MLRALGLLRLRRAGARLFDVEVVVIVGRAEIAFSSLGVVIIVSAGFGGRAGQFGIAVDKGAFVVLAYEARGGDGVAKAGE